MTLLTVLSISPNVINLNVTISNTTHIVTANETIFDIAKQYSVGACDIARLNVLEDPLIIYEKEVFNIPAIPTFPDDDSCFQINNTNTNNTCVYGGPHVYTIQPGDTLQKIANVRFNLTMDSITSFSAQTGYLKALNPGPYDELESGQSVKIPVCENTACTMSDFTFSYGTLQDFANFYNITPGQIMALNPGYNHTEAIAPLSVLYDCQLLSV